jgi:hypothetical protein
VANDSRDPWSANCAIPELLFRDSSAFTKAFPQYTIELNALNECFLFPLSGGVIAKTRTITFPAWFYNFVAQIDRVLVRLIPSVFALGCSVVLRKR